MDEEYVKQLEQSNDKLQRLAEHNLELVDLFKHLLSQSKMEVVLDGTGDYTLTYSGNMVKNIYDHQIKELAKRYNGFKMSEWKAAKKAGMKETR